MPVIAVRWWDDLQLLAVSHLNAHLQSLGRTSKLFFSVDMFFSGVL